MPSVFYGDEAGIEGYGDPFCRRTFPWGQECEELVSYYKRLGAIRSENPVLADGEFEIEYAEGARIVYTRTSDNCKLTVVVNASDEPFAYPSKGKTDILFGERYNGTVAPMTAVILG